MDNATAMLAAVQAAPTDAGLRLIAADALADADRNEESDRQRQLADLLIGTRRIKLSADQERKIRRWRGVRPCPVKVEMGNAHPHEIGEEGYNEFKGGGRCKYPGAAMRKGYKVRYVRSTREVVVGIGWLITEGIVR